MTEKFVCIKVFTNHVEADLAKNFLGMNEIEAFTQADDVAGTYPGLSYSSGVKLLVEEKNKQKAVELLETTYDADDIDIED
jgi:hypothetical protein